MPKTTIPDDCLDDIKCRCPRCEESWQIRNSKLVGRRAPCYTVGYNTTGSRGQVIRLRFGTFATRKDALAWIGDQHWHIRNSRRREYPTPEAAEAAIKRVDYRIDKDLTNLWERPDGGKWTGAIEWTPSTETGRQMSCGEKKGDEGR